MLAFSVLAVAVLGNGRRLDGHGDCADDDAGVATATGGMAATCEAGVATLSSMGGGCDTDFADVPLPSAAAYAGTTVAQMCPVTCDSCGAAEEPAAEEPAA